VQKVLFLFRSTSHLSDADREADRLECTCGRRSGLTNGCNMERKDAVNYPAQYRSDLLTALDKMDLPLVAQAIDVFMEARTLNRRIFVCGNGASATAAAQFLCDLVKGTGYNLSSRFRVLALTDQHPSARIAPEDVRGERVFVDQLQTVAESGDVVMGISAAGNAASLVCALEYAIGVGCRTITLTGPDGWKLQPLADVHIVVPATQAASVEDGLMIVCHMIGNYFQRFDAV
jgi:D-sedoheptulose 7-phosphate isomerase